MTTEVAARVAALVEEQGYRRLLARLRQRLERGGHPRTVLLRGLDADERRALADLLGSAERLEADVRVSLDELDASLQASRVGAGLIEVLEALGGPLRDERAERRAKQRAWDELFADLAAGSAGPAWRREWVDGLRRGILKRLTSDIDDARDAVRRATAVMAHLPGDGVLLADLAARATGDPHALDPGRGGALPALVLSAVAAQLGLPPDQPSDARDRRDLWASVGVQCDPLSATVLVHGLRVTGTSLVAETLRAHATAGEPVRLTLRQLQDHGGLDLLGGVLHVCENPSIVAAAADRLGPACRPVLCVEGVPSTATHALLDALGDIELRVHADFDAGGIRIGNLLHRRTDVVPWRFSAVDYLEALASIDHTIPVTTAVDDATWDSDLSESMRAHRQAIHEEQVLAELLGDLRLEPAQGGYRLLRRTNVSDVRAQVERHRDELLAAARRHRASNVRLFGSVAEGRAEEDSDVDFLVDFEAGATLLDLADLKDEFAEILGRDVDVLSARALKPRDEDIRRAAVPL